MANESDVDVQTTETEEQEGVEETESEETEESKETDEAKLARLRRQTERLEKKLGVGTKKETKTTNSELDYGQKAFLVANGIKGSDEIAFVTEVMKSTGRSLEQVLESKYFQAELKEMRDAKSVTEAIPKGTKRTATTARNEVEYWIQKGELPPDTPENRKLRQEVVNARIKSSGDTSPFTSNPVGNVIRK